MKKERLDALADGMFAIIMTLLVIEIRIPELHGDAVTNMELFRELIALWPLFTSYVLSFLVLSSYWMAHNFIVSILSENMTRKLAYLNILFLSVVALIPFSSHFLGVYNDTQIAVMLFGANVMAISLMLYFIFLYTLKSPDIKNNMKPFSRADLHYAEIRLLLPVFGAIIAIIWSFYNPTISIAIFVGVVIFNFIPGSLHFIDRCAAKVFKTWK